MAIPGMEKPWDMQLLWRYIQHRSQTCKPTKEIQILSKLRHFGVLHGHVLANTKFNADPAQYGLIKKMKKQVTLDVRAEAAQAGVDYVGVDRCTHPNRCTGREYVVVVIRCDEQSSVRGFASRGQA